MYSCSPLGNTHTTVPLNSTSVSSTEVDLSIPFLNGRTCLTSSGTLLYVHWPHVFFLNPNLSDVAHYCTPYGATVEFKVKMKGIN